MHIALAGVEMAPMSTTTASSYDESESAPGNPTWAVPSWIVLFQHRSCAPPLFGMELRFMRTSETCHFAHLVPPVELACVLGKHPLEVIGAQLPLRPSGSTSRIVLGQHPLEVIGTQLLSEVWVCRQGGAAVKTRARVPSSRDRVLPRAAWDDCQ